MAINFLDNIQLNQNQLLGARIENVTSDPSTANGGDIIFNSTTGKLKYYDGTTPFSSAGWISLPDGTGVVGTGTVGTIPIWGPNATTLGDSAISVTGTGASTTLGITYPFTRLDTLRVQGDLIDINAQAGTAGQLLSSLGSGNGIDWIDAPVSYTKWIADGGSATTEDVNDGDTYKPDESTTRPGIIAEAVTKSSTTITQPLGLFTKNMSLNGPGDYATDVLLWGPDTTFASHKVNKTRFTDVTISVWSEAEADLVLGGFKITDVGAPTAGGDAANKTYVDNLVVGNLVFQGGYNASTNIPNLDASPNPNNIKKGWSYVVTTPGTFFTEAVEVGDFLIAQQDAPTTLANWVTVQNNVGLATPSTVGIGNVNASAVEELLGIDVVYSAGTASVGLDIDGLGAITTTNDASYLAIFDEDNSANKKIDVSDLGSVINSATSFAGNNASSGTSHTFTHNLGTGDVSVQLYDTSTKETIYATVDRTGVNTVVVTTASSISAGSIRALISKIG